MLFKTDSLLEVIIISKLVSDLVRLAICWRLGNIQPSHPTVPIQSSRPGSIRNRSAIWGAQISFIGMSITTIDKHDLINNTMIQP